jgi:hypothetical protein
MIRHLRTGSREVVWTCLVLLASTPSLAAEVSDTLPIAGRYSQNGKAIKPRDMEAMLESIDSCAPMVHRARGCRIAGKAIGATITLGSLAISAVQMRAMIDAIQRAEPLTNTLAQWTLPLTIGTEVGAFVQARLVNRSDYLTHKALLAYNRRLCARGVLDSLPSLRIEKIRGRTGMYTQSGLVLSTSTLSYVLTTQPASSDLAVGSVAMGEIGSRAIGFGAMYLALAIVAAVEHQPHQTNTVIGGSVTGLGVVLSIAGLISRVVAVKRYNAEVPGRVRCGERSVPGAAPPDTAVENLGGQ